MANPVSPGEPAKRRGDFVRSLWLGTLLVNLFVFGMVGLIIQRHHESEVAQAVALTDNYSKILEEALSGFISKIDITLQTVGAEAERQLASGGIDDKALEALIARQDALIPEALGLRVVDVDTAKQRRAGAVRLASARQEVVPRPHLAKALQAKVQQRLPAVAHLPLVLEQCVRAPAAQFALQDQVQVELCAAHVGLQRGAVLQHIARAHVADQLGVQGQVKGPLALRQQHIVLPVDGIEPCRVHRRPNGAAEQLGVPARIHAIAQADFGPHHLRTVAVARGPVAEVHHLHAGIAVGIDHVIARVGLHRGQAKGQSKGRQGLQDSPAPLCPLGVVVDHHTAPARFQHPHLVRVLEIGSVRGRDFVAFEFVDGGTLTKWLTEAPRHATVLARTALERGASLVISVGGDGTNNEVLNGFVDVEAGRIGTLLRKLPMAEPNPCDHCWKCDARPGCPAYGAEAAESRMADLEGAGMFG